MPYPARAFLLLTAILVVATCARAADPTPGVTIMGGVADPSNKVVYLSDPAGSIVAVDIDKGTLLWESKEATVPVASLGKQVFALAPEKGQANVFRVVTLDAGDKGKVVRKSDPIVLPDWADVGDVNDRNFGPKIFGSHSNLDGDILKVRWWAATTPVNKNGNGEARIDLTTGKVTLAPAKPQRFEQPKHSAAVMKVIVKRNWNTADPIVATGGRVFGRTGRSNGADYELTLQVADLETGEFLWKRVIQQMRAAPEK